MPVIVAAAAADEAPARLAVRAKLLFAPPLPRRLNPAPRAGLVSVRDSALVFALEQRVFVVDYPSIVIYAISRDPPCIYCQLDNMAVESDLPLDGEGNGSEDNGNDNDDEEDPTFEMRIVPDDPSKLDDLFLAITECAALHPDKNALQDDGDDDEGWMMTADDFNDEDMLGARQAALDHLESVFVGGVRKETEDRFEDADESEPKRVKEHEGER
ncbi:regulator of volume decrease after cellular swelling-domain-containing protein [Obelidium mucronatum]|nr:regulator of volume decrease after cellular swelling-domain-containing protein [Obelidium mucronatum]